MNVFSSTLNQTAFLFSFIVLGFLFAKYKVIPENSGTVIAKLENTLFVPALVFNTFIKNFTVKQFESAWKILAVSLVMIIVIMPISVLISRCVTKNKYEKNIYTYGLAFSNFGFMGNAVVNALFPDIFLEYIIFTLPLWTMIYLWGVPVLLIADCDGKQTLGKRLKAFLNPMFFAMIVGSIIGLSGLRLPSWFESVVSVSGDCMSPMAMLLTGITVSSISMKKTFADMKIYAVSIIRLVIIPLMFLFVSPYLHLSRTLFICALCSLAMPLGLNTIVIPNAYGKDTSVGAGMAIISHLLSCITIPLIFALVL